MAPPQNDLVVWPEDLQPGGSLPLIVFDLDGTLVDSYEMALLCHARTIEAVGLPPVSRRVLESLNGPTIEEECRILGFPMERMGELEAAMTRVEVELAPVMARTFPGVPEMLASLQSGGAVLCVLTNGLPHYMKLVCGITGIDRYVTESAAYTPGVSKAARIRQWMEARGLPRALAVGDRPTDVDAGRMAGARTLAVTYGNGTAEQLAHADYLASTVAEAWRLCERFCEGKD